MRIAYDKEGLSNRVLSWIQQLKLNAGQTHNIRIQIVNGIFKQGISDNEKNQSDTVHALNKVDLKPILNRLKRCILRIDMPSAEVEVVIAINQAGEIMDGDIHIRSGFGNELPVL